MRVTINITIPQRIVDLGKKAGYPEDKIQELYIEQAEGYLDVYGYSIDDEVEKILEKDLKN